MTSWKDTRRDIALDFNNCSANGTLKAGFITFFFNVSFQLLVLYRLFHYFSQRRGLGFLALPLMYSQKILTGCYIHPGAELGQRVNFPHPTGIVIGQNVKIRQGVTIFQGVTLGSHGKPGDPQMGYPVIEDNATLYANAIIIGGIRVGKNSIVGAGAVVLKDVPDNVITAGVPARTLRSIE